MFPQLSLKQSDALDQFVVAPFGVVRVRLWGSHPRALLQLIDRKSDKGGVEAASCLTSEMSVGLPAD